MLFCRDMEEFYKNLKRTDEKERARNRASNNKGHFFEKLIETACDYYKEQGLANINKVPEPFRVIKKELSGRFQGQFIKKAEPDFKGVLKNGRAITFECKLTNKSSISKRVLTETQERELEMNYKLGAIVGVCLCFDGEEKTRYFFVTWEFWRNIEKTLGKKSVKTDEISAFEVFYKSPQKGVDFLENINN